MASRVCSEAAAYVEFEEVVVGRGCRYVELCAFGYELVAEDLTDSGVLDVPCSTSHKEGVFVVLARVGVQGVAAVAVEVPLFRGGDDEREDAAFVEQWAHRVHSWAPVHADRREVPEPDSVLVEERPACGGDFWNGLPHLAPRRHGLRRFHVELSVSTGAWLAPW